MVDTLNFLFTLNNLLTTTKIIASLDISVGDVIELV